MCDGLGLVCPAYNHWVHSHSPRRRLKSRHAFWVILLWACFASFKTIQTGADDDRFGPVVYRWKMHVCKPRVAKIWRSELYTPNRRCPCAELQSAAERKSSLYSITHVVNSDDSPILLKRAMQCIPQCFQWLHSHSSVSLLKWNFDIACCFDKLRSLCIHKGTFHVVLHGNNIMQYMCHNLKLWKAWFLKVKVKTKQTQRKEKQIRGNNFT